MQFNKIIGNVGPHTLVMIFMALFEIKNHWHYVDTYMLHQNPILNANIKAKTREFNEIDIFICDMCSNRE